jgi:hypothetical protein
VSANTIAAVIAGVGIRRLAALACLALAAALLAACGSSSQSGSEQFRDKTHSPLLGFGQEASEAEMETAADSVESFFTARAKGEWGEACAQLSRAALAKIEHLATTATQLADTSCPSFLGAFIQVGPSQRRESTEFDPGSLRVKGRLGYLIYYGAGEAVYAMPMSHEGGAWKVGSLSAKELS